MSNSPLSPCSLQGIHYLVWEVSTLSLLFPLLFPAAVSLTVGYTDGQLYSIRIIPVTLLDLFLVIVKYAY